jgi:hypothetical protein
LLRWRRSTPQMIVHGVIFHDAPWKPPGHHRETAGYENSDFRSQNRVIFQEEKKFKN